MKPAQAIFCCVLLAVCFATSCGGGSGNSGVAASPANSPAPASNSFSVQPAAPVLLPGEQVRFVAAADRNAVTDVDWYVNGVRGGSAAAGTITSDGSYKAPHVPVSTTVRAIRRSDSRSANAAVTVSATSEEGVRPTIFRIVGEDVGPAPSPADTPVVIFGANFASDARVMVAGQQRAVTFVSAHELHTTLPPLKTPGEVPLFVINPGTPERIAARNLHVAKDYEHDIPGLAPFAAMRAIADPVRNRALFVSAWSGGLDLVALDLQSRAVAVRFAIPNYVADIDTTTGKIYVLQPIDRANPTKYSTSLCSIDVFDSIHGTFLNSIPLAAGRCTDIRIQPALHRAYLPDNALGAIRVLDLQTGTEEVPIGPFAVPIVLRLQPASTMAVVVSGIAAQDAAVVDLTTGFTTHNLHLDAAAGEFTLDEPRGRLYVGTEDNFNFELRAYDLSGGVVADAVISATPFYGAAIGAAILISPDGKHLLVSALRDFAGGIVAGDAWVIDADSVTVRSRIPLTQSGHIISVGNTIVSAWYTVTLLDLAKDLTGLQLGAVTATRNGPDQIDLSITGEDLAGLEPVLYFDGAPVELTAVAGQQSSFRATVPIAWADSTQLHSVWMGAIEQTPTNVLGFGFSAQPFATDAWDATFCLGDGGLAIVADNAAARWLDLRQGAELHRTFPGARACAFDDSGALAVMLNTSGLRSYATATGSLISTAPSIPGNTVVVDSKTGLAYTGGGAVVDTATGQLVQTLPRFIGWDHRDLGFDGYLGIDAQTRRLVSYWYSLDLAGNNASESGINYAIAGPDGAAAPWGAFGVDRENHLAIMPWRYGRVVLIDMRSGQLQTSWTGGELYFGACAGHGLGFVLDRVTPAVIAVDLQTGDTVAKFASPPLPSECAYDPGTQTVWVLSTREGQLFSIAVGKALAPPPPPPPAS